MGTSLVTNPPRMASLIDLLAVLVKLGDLPRRQSVNVEVSEAVFMMALHDPHSRAVAVAACDLDTAMLRILAGELQHGFHPSPPELRMVCDRVRDERLKEQHRVLREQRMTSVFGGSSFATSRLLRRRM